MTIPIEYKMFKFIETKVADCFCRFMQNKYF